MNFVPLTIGEKEYKLRLDTKNTTALEKIVGTNPVNVLMEVSEGQLPTVSFVAACLHASLQKFQTGMTMTKVYDLLDEAAEEDKTAIDFIPTLMEVFQTSGLIPKDKKEEEVQDPQ